MITRESTAGTKNIVRKGRELRVGSFLIITATKKATGFWMASVTTASTRAFRRDLQKIGSARRIVLKFFSPTYFAEPNPDQSVRLKYPLSAIGATMANRITAIAGVTSTAMAPGREKMDLLTDVDLRV
jgi:hypothetical protein